MCVPARVKMELPNGEELASVGGCLGAVEVLGMMQAQVETAIGLRHVCQATNAPTLPRLSQEPST
jgi:hypothetical protein